MKLRAGFPPAVAGSALPGLTHGAVLGLGWCRKRVHILGEVSPVKLQTSWVAGAVTQLSKDTCVFSALLSLTSNSEVGYLCGHHLTSIAPPSGGFHALTVARRVVARWAQHQRRQP